ncbi:DUF4907 domain-containing protein [Paraflavitalea speifideaquila]|uniref:DUF4907 domain-containing protein n=1 Tax=Paraflavitalea speifideaquila TaxID=3076558 RepID=UPI0028EAF38E|nr:DUF4907 domain-containing protein [Paraflavitalea speifideiaquila]
MTTNKARRIIIAAVVIAVAITSVKLYWQHRQQSANALSYRCFANGQHWGYDILVGEKIVIHQSIDPEAKGRIGFASKEAAEADARIVIGNIKLGETPVFNAHKMQRTGTLPAQ